MGLLMKCKTNGHDAMRLWIEPIFCCDIRLYSPHAYFISAHLFYHQNMTSRMVIVYFFVISMNTGATCFWQKSIKKTVDLAYSFAFLAGIVR